MNALDSTFIKNSSYIDGQWHSNNRETFEITNPANGEITCTLNSADKNDALMAVDAAVGAMPAWHAKTAKQRSAILRRWFELIMQNQDDLAAILTEEQAIALANDTEVGLASYIYTRDIGRVWRVSEALEYVMVSINEYIISNEMATFGGAKESGMDREGSKYGLDDYLEIKYLCMGGLDK